MYKCGKASMFKSVYRLEQKIAKKIDLLLAD